MGEKATEAAAAVIQEERRLTPAAQRALAEAEARQAAKAEKQEAENGKAADKEIGGRQEGKEPTRFGDWEFKGRAIDF